MNLFLMSYVSSEIAASDDASFKKGVPDGGSFAISQGLGGQYNINYEIFNFTSKIVDYYSKANLVIARSGAS